MSSKPKDKQANTLVLVWSFKIEELKQPIGATNKTCT